MENTKSLNELLKQLRLKNPAAESLLSICKIAVNGSIVESESELRNEDKVALLPPFSGG